MPGGEKDWRKMAILREIYQPGKYAGSITPKFSNKRGSGVRSSYPESFSGANSTGPELAIYRRCGSQANQSELLLGWGQMRNRYREFGDM